VNLDKEENLVSKDHRDNLDLKDHKEHEVKEEKLVLLDQLVQ